MRQQGARKWAGWVLVAGVTMATLAGCTSNGGDEATSSPGVVRTEGSPPAARDGLSMEPQSADRGDALARGSAEDRKAEGDAKPDVVSMDRIAVGGRKLARSAGMSLRSDDLTSAAAQVRSIAARAGGYTGSEVAGKKSANLTVTVPSAKLDAVLEQLADIGEVTQREVQVTDVTEEVVDTDSRVASQRASVARIRALLSRARTISEIVSIEGELTARQAELESLLARQKALEGMVAMSPISVTILPLDAADAEEPRGGFLGGLDSGWSAFVTATAFLLTALGAVLPFVLVLGVPIAVFVWWLLRRRPRASAPAAAQAGDSGSA